MTNLRLARQDRLRLAREPGRTAKAHDASTTTDACGGTIPHAIQVQQLVAMQAAHPDKSLNLGLTGCHPIAIISHSATRKLSPRHLSTLYDAHEPRLRLGRGKLGKYSGRLRQARTTQRTSQASRNE
jgi:hypothetical protein